MWMMVFTHWGVHWLLSGWESSSSKFWLASKHRLVSLAQRTEPRWKLPSVWNSALSHPMATPLTPWQLLLPKHQGREGVRRGVRKQAWQEPSGLSEPWFSGIRLNGMWGLVWIKPRIAGRHMELWHLHLTFTTHCPLHLRSSSQSEQRCPEYYHFKELKQTNKKQTQNKQASTQAA